MVLRILLHLNVLQTLDNLDEENLSIFSHLWKFDEGLKFTATVESRNKWTTNNFEIFCLSNRQQWFEIYFDTKFELRTTTLNDHEVIIW